MTGHWMCLKLHMQLVKTADTLAWPGPNPAHPPPPGRSLLAAAVGDANELPLWSKPCEWVPLGECGCQVALYYALLYSTVFAVACLLTRSALVIIIKCGPQPPLQIPLRWHVPWQAQHVNNGNCLGPRHSSPGRGDRWMSKAGWKITNALVTLPVRHYYKYDQQNRGQQNGQIWQLISGFHYRNNTKKLWAKQTY